jgi:hypothetical protein
LRLCISADVCVQRYLLLSLPGGAGAPIVVAKKPFSLKDLKDKKDSKNLEVPIYNFDLSKDKKSLKDAIGLGRKMF